MTTDAVLTVAEVASLLRVSRDAVAAGTIPALRVGRTLHVSRSVVDGWLASGTLGAAAEPKPALRVVKRRVWK